MGLKYSFFFLILYNLLLWNTFGILGIKLSLYLWEWLWSISFTSGIWFCIAPEYSHRICLTMLNFVSWSIYLSLLFCTLLTTKIVYNIQMIYINLHNILFIYLDFINLIDEFLIRIFMFFFLLTHLLFEKAEAWL